MSEWHEADLSRVADALYALKPDDFAAARDAEVRSAREARQPALAREIGKLRKPTQSAWLINLLWRDQQAVMEQLFELAQELTRAQADAAGPALRELMTQRRQLENALLRRAVELAAEAGVRVSDSVAREAQETLSAALALPDVADEVRAGRLVKPSSYAGFGAAAPSTSSPRRAPPAPIDLAAARQQRADAVEQDRAAAPEQERASADNQRQSVDGQPRKVDKEQRRAAETDRHAAEEAQRRAAEEADKERQRQAAERRAEAERRLAQARREAERATARRVDASQAAEAAHARAGDLRQRLDTLRQQLQRLESEVDTADASATEADTNYAEAEQHNTEADKAVGEAEAALSSLTE